MAIYGKLEDGKLIVAPKSITIGHVTYKPATKAVYVQAGYKEVTYTAYPGNGNIYEEYWEELQAQIVQRWRLIRELTPSEKREKAYEDERCCEYNGELYTVDELESLYYKYFAETGKENICSELKSVITDGKNHIREEYPEEN